MERPNEKIWLSVETMKLLNELNLTEEKTAEALVYLFPDVYNAETALKQAKNIKEKKMLSAYTPEQKKNFNFVDEDMEMLTSELKSANIIM